MPADVTVTLTASGEKTPSATISTVVTADSVKGGVTQEIVVPIGGLTADGVYTMQISVSGNSVTLSISTE